MTGLIDHTYLISARMRNFPFDEMTKFSKGASDKKSRTGEAWNRGYFRPAVIIVNTVIYSTVLLQGLAAQETKRGR